MEGLVGNEEGTELHTKGQRSEVGQVFVGRLQTVRSGIPDDV